MKRSNTVVGRHADCARAAAALTAALACLGPAAAFAQETTHPKPSIRFEDTTEEVGLSSLLKDWVLGHCGAWADVNSDGRPDLYVGAFADRPIYGKEGAPIANQLLLNTAEGFVLSPDATVRMDGLRARTTYAMGVDFDNDADLDLMVVTHAANEKMQQTQLFENDGAGRFTVRKPEGEGWPLPLAARNVAPIDFDGDGLLDLIITDAAYAKRNRGTARLYALRQVKPWQFEDVTEAMGLPLEKCAGNGLAVADVNDDGMLDFFVADANRLFVSTPEHTYIECEQGRFIGPLFLKDRDSMTCGAALGDLNGDGLPDLVTTVHGQPAQVDVYLHQGIGQGLPTYRRVTRELGLETPLPRESAAGLPVKGAHVAIVDLNNDNRNDILLPIVWKDDAGRLQPVVLENLGQGEDSLPAFTPLPLQQMHGYYAQGPVADYDGDGRLDVFLPTWFEELPSILFRNTSSAGHWLAVQVQGEPPGMNRQGIGATVRIYRAGHTGEAKHLLGRREITLGNGYSSGELARVHFGLADLTHCDVVVSFQGKTQTLANAAADQLLTVRFAGQ